MTFLYFFKCYKSCKCFSIKALCLLWLIHRYFLIYISIVSEYYFKFSNMNVSKNCQLLFNLLSSKLLELMYQLEIFVVLNLLDFLCRRVTTSLKKMTLFSSLFFVSVPGITPRWLNYYHIILISFDNQYFIQYFTFFLFLRIVIKTKFLFYFNYSYLLLEVWSQQSHKINVIGTQPGFPKSRA